MADEKGGHEVYVPRANEALPEAENGDPEALPKELVQFVLDNRDYLRNRMADFVEQQEKQQAANGEAHLLDGNLKIRPELTRDYDTLHDYVSQYYPVLLDEKVSVLVRSCRNADNKTLGWLGSELLQFTNEIQNPPRIISERDRSWEPVGAILMTSMVGFGLQLLEELDRLKLARDREALKKEVEGKK